MSREISVFFIQNCSFDGWLKTNSMPAFSASSERNIKPTSREDWVSAISTRTVASVWPSGDMISTRGVDSHDAATAAATIRIAAINVVSGPLRQYPPAYAYRYRSERGE